jgi:hypothetical protein
MKTKNMLFKEFRKIIKDEVIKYKFRLDTRGSKPIYSVNKFINIFLEKLETNLSWEKLESIYKISKSQLHITFTKWSNNNVFRNAYESFLKRYSLYIKNDIAYIDTTTIFNKYGYLDTVGMNTYESKKHKSNKVSIIANEKGIPLGINIGKGNIHDIKLLMDTLPKNIFFNKLYADKSYVSKKLKENLLQKNIKIITPNKKNQKVSNTREDQYELKNRMKIEHINNRLKQNRSLNTRYMKDIKNFESLIYLGCLKIGLQILIFDFYNL